MQSSRRKNHIVSLNEIVDALTKEHTHYFQQKLMVKSIFATTCGLAYALFSRHPSGRT